MAEDDFFSNFDGEESGPDRNRAASGAPSVASISGGKEPRLPMSRGMIVTIICLIVPLLFGIVCGILAASMGEKLGRLAWQYLIGIGGGVSATMLFGVAIYWLDEKNILEYHLPVIFLLIGLSILNFVLRCYLADATYKIVFICLGILICGLSFFFCFHLIDPPWIVTMAIGCAFSIAFLISGWTMPSWGVWQWIIGGMISVLFLAPIFVLEYKGEFIRYAVSLIATVILLAVNFLLMRKFAENYKVIFVWISSSALIASLISIAVRHQKGDGAWGKVSVVPLLGGAVLLILGLVL